MKPNFTIVKDVAFNNNALVAFGKYFIPATMQTPEYAAIILWLSNLKEPIIVTFDAEEDRDQAYDKLLKSMSQQE